MVGEKVLIENVSTYSDIRLESCAKLFFCLLRALPGSRNSVVRVSKNEIIQESLDEYVDDAQPRDGFVYS